MKVFASILFVAVLAVATSAYAQVDLSNDNLSSVGKLNGSTAVPNSGSTSPARVAGSLSLELAKDSMGKHPTSTFGRGETVYLICTNVTANKGDKVAVTWYGGKENQKLAGTEASAPKDGMFSTAYNLPLGKSDLPKGDYHVDFMVSGKAQKSLKFTVK